MYKTMYTIYKKTCVKKQFTNYVKFSLHYNKRCNLPLGLEHILSGFDNEFAQKVCLTLLQAPIFYGPPSSPRLLRCSYATQVVG